MGDCSTNCNPCGPSYDAINQLAVQTKSYARQALSAVTTVEEFQSLYLGAKATAPTTDNEGNPLQVGALYFNTTDGEMYVWAGSAWEFFGQSGFYLGPKASDPTTDNEGGPLVAGLLYFNTVSNTMRVYNGTFWQNVSFDESTPFIATGTTEPRNLVTRFADVVNVKDFGAVGDGVADDTVAIQAAIDAGSLILFNQGDTYKVTGLNVGDNKTLNFNNSKLTTDSSGIDLLNVTGDNVVIENIFHDFNEIKPFEISDYIQITGKNCIVRNCTLKKIVYDSGYTMSSFVKVKGIRANIHNNYISTERSTGVCSGGIVNGIRIEDGGDYCNVYQNRIIGCNNNGISSQGTVPSGTTGMYGTNPIQYIVGGRIFDNYVDGGQNYRTFINIGSGAVRDYFISRNKVTRSADNGIDCQNLINTIIEDNDIDANYILHTPAVAGSLFVGTDPIYYASKNVIIKNNRITLKTDAVINSAMYSPRIRNLSIIGNEFIGEKQASVYIAQNSIKSDLETDEYNPLVLIVKDNKFTNCSFESNLFNATNPPSDDLGDSAIIENNIFNNSEYGCILSESKNISVIKNTFSNITKVPVLIKEKVIYCNFKDNFLTKTNTGSMNSGDQPIDNRNTDTTYEPYCFFGFALTKDTVPTVTGQLFNCKRITFESNRIDESVMSSAWVYKYDELVQYNGTSKYPITRFATVDWSFTYYYKNNINLYKTLLNGTSQPNSGIWNRGDIVLNAQPSAGGNAGWICVTDGDFSATPPVFKTFGTISA